MTKFISPTFLVVYILIFGSFLRIYNINFDDLWIDEISTFWVANPNFSFYTSYSNHITLEQTPYVFNFLIKIFFSVFGYNIEIARYIPAISSILSIIVVTLISKEISKKNDFVLVAFLTCFNIFLIAYAQELRVYSTFFLFSSLSLLFFIRTIKENNIFNVLFFGLATIILVFLHHYALILIISYLVFLITNIIIKKEKISSNLVISFTIFIISCLYYYFSIKNSTSTPEWMEQPDIKFYTNFYFSKFFGSRLLGLIFLFLLILLSLKNIKVILNNNHLKLLLIIIFISYSLPLIYGYIFRPVIVPRYIIFVLIPIILILSNLTFELDKKYKNIIFTLIVIITIGNLFTEQTFKQFFEKRIPHKPEVSKSLDIINKSKINFVFPLVNSREEELVEAWTKSIYNYLNYLIKYNQLNINLVNKTDYNEDLWLICIHDLNQNNCNLSNQFNLIKEYKLNRLDLILVKKKIN